MKEIVASMTDWDDKEPIHQAVWPVLDALQAYLTHADQTRLDDENNMQLLKKWITRHAEGSLEDRRALERRLNKTLQSKGMSYKFKNGFLET